MQRLELNSDDKIPHFFVSSAKHCTNKEMHKTSGGHRTCSFISTIENPRTSRFYIYQQKNWFMRLMSLFLVVHSNLYQSLEPV